MFTAIGIVAAALVAFWAGMKYKDRVYKAAYVIKADGIKEFDAAITAVKTVRDEAKAKAAAIEAVIKSKL